MSRSQTSSPPLSIHQPGPGQKTLRFAFLRHLTYHHSTSLNTDSPQYWETVESGVLLGSLSYGFGNAGRCLGALKTTRTAGKRLGGCAHMHIIHHIGRRSKQRTLPRHVQLPWVDQVCKPTQRLFVDRSRVPRDPSLHVTLQQVPLHHVI